MLFIIRNQHEYGPYGVSDIARYVEEGRLLLNDRARDAESGDEGTVEELLGARGIHPHVRSRGSLMQQLRYIGHAFIFPKDDMERHHLMEDKRLLILAIVGLSLSIIMLLPIGGYLVFYAVSLYFATIWGLFFSYFFRTRQISKGKAVSTFFLTQLGVFIIFSGLNELNFFYNFTSAPFPLSILGYILGIGLTEEFAKMIPLLVLERRAREPAATDDGVLWSHGGYCLRRLRGCAVSDVDQHPGRLHHGFCAEHRATDLPAVSSCCVGWHLRLLRRHGRSLSPVSQVALCAGAVHPRHAPWPLRPVCRRLLSHLFGHRLPECLPPDGLSQKEQCAEREVEKVAPRTPYVKKLIELLVIIIAHIAE